MKNRKIVLLAIITLGIMLLNVVMFFNKIVLPKIEMAELEKEYLEKYANIKKDNIVLNSEGMTDYQWALFQLKGENDRMKYYVSRFLTFVMELDYEKAYELLYDEFKTRHFDTYEKFEDYAKEKYSISMSVEYTDVQVQGDTYIVFVTIKDNLFTRKDRTQTFVVKEDDFNNFVLSFSV